MTDYKYEMPPLPGASEIITSTGVVLWVYPLTYYDQKRFINEAQELYAEPNPDAYRKPIPADVAGYENAFTSGLDDPAYLQAVAVYKQKLNTYATDQTFLACVDSPHGVDFLIERYASVVRRKTRGNASEAAWLATLKYAILEKASDIGAVIKAAEIHLPLSAGEVAEGVRIFRSQNESSADGIVLARPKETPLPKTG